MGRRRDVAFWHLADNPTAPAFVRYWRNSGQQPILASEGLSAYDPKATFRSVAGSNDGLQFPDCLGLLPFSMESQSGSG
jgi:hypothetical protein